MWLALALACAERPADRAYLDATLGEGGCADVANSALRGECFSFSARNLAEAGELDEALARCDQAEALWRDECVFLVSDTVDATFELADRLCNRAISLRPQCLGHASNREARALLTDRGGETAALARITQRVRAFRGEAMARDEARRLVLQKLAARDADAPFSPAICGDLAPDLCRDVYIERLLRTGGVDPKSGCSDAAARQSIAPWAPEADALVSAAWAALCTRGAG